MRVEVVSRQGINKDRERVKAIVTLDDGSTRDYWPYKKPGIADSVIETEAIAHAQQSIDDAAAAELTKPVERVDVDALMARLKAAGLVDGSTYDEVKDEILVDREEPK